MVDPARPVLPDDARARLVAQLVRHEGLRLRPYRDAKGKITIGVGRNLTDVGISRAEALELLDHDVDAAIRGLVARFPAWFGALDPVRQAAIVNVAFNLGVGVFADFTVTIGAIAAGDYDRAAAAMLRSTWAQQVGPRALELAAQVKTGTWAAP